MNASLSFIQHHLMQLGVWEHEFTICGAPLSAMCGAFAHSPLSRCHGHREGPSSSTKIEVSAESQMDVEHCVISRSGGDLRLEST